MECNMRSYIYNSKLAKNRSGKLRQRELRLKYEALFKQ